MWAFTRATIAGGLAVVLVAGCGGSAQHVSRIVRAAAPRLAASAPAPPAEVPVVPRPRAEQLGAGGYAWPRRVRIGAGSAERNVAEQLRAYLAHHGVAAAIVARGSRAEAILSASDGYDERLGSEGYVLRVQPTGVALRANTAHGVFYALQTLEQLSTRSGRGLTSRAVAIVDWPAYGWRGIHLDVARHFFSVPVVERFIDAAAHYKLNVFHWHLTDDEAWRLASTRYPALGAGGKRYSKADVRDVIAYAARRYVTVVPEIELPSHSGAAVRAYPNLFCGNGTLCTHGAGLTFARNVVTDAIGQFPSPYLHAGGDEVPAAAAGAQPRFTQELERVVEARGRRLVGWDEIFNPQLSPHTVVMVWTDRKRAARIVRHGNDVVLASGAFYFDGAQGDPAQEPPASRHMSTLENVYDDGMAPGLTAREATHVLGGQANVWTEHIATPERLFAMTFPRELALAEVLWTPRERKSWGSFVTRLPAQFAWLDAQRYGFRVPNASFALAGGSSIFTAVPGRVQSVDAWTNAPEVTVTLSVPLSSAAIRYTTNGTAPTRASPLYRRPIRVPVGGSPLRLRARAFYRERAGAVTECVLRRVSAAQLRARRNASDAWGSLVSP